MSLWNLHATKKNGQWHMFKDIIYIVYKNKNVRNNLNIVLIEYDLKD